MLRVTCMDVVDIIGSGMLGRAVQRAVERRGATCRVIRTGLLDLSEHDIQSPIVINCASRSRSGPRTLFALNGSGPRYLAHLCHRRGARLIHISSDCIFCGRGPHLEIDTPTPKTVYAWSRFLGEPMDPPHLTIRAGFVGPNGGLVDDLRHNRPVRVSSDVHLTPLWVDELADLIMEITQRPEIGGLLHVPGEPLTRTQLVEHLKTVLKSRSPLVQEPIVWDRRLGSVLWDDYGLPRPRPFEEQLRVWRVTK